MKKIVKPDISNEDQEYWEQVLESYGLGLTPKSTSSDVMDLPGVEEGLSIEEAEELGLLDGN
jgi:hypothetical protein